MAVTIERARMRNIIAWGRRCKGTPDIVVDRAAIGPLSSVRSMFADMDTVPDWPGTPESAVVFPRHAARQGLPFAV
jgi:hypothetical protein